jgi:hypothetical protein
MCRGAYGVVVAPEGEVDLVLEQQVLDIGPQLARDRLIGSVASVTVLDPSPPPSPATTTTATAATATTTATATNKSVC